MKLTLCSALLLALLAGAKAGAQTIESVKADCDRAWLGTDWPSVVVSCAPLADEFESYGDSSSKEIAALCRARVSLAYAKLQRGKLSSDQRRMAIADLGPALAADPSKEGNAGLVARAKALKQLLQSSTFVRDAPQSDVLAEIK